MDAYRKYFKSISEKLDSAFGQKEKILTASSWIAHSIASNGWIYTSGTGHSHLLSEEIFYRAGGFARVIPILDPALMLHENASKSSEIEQKEGYAAQLLSKYQITSTDVFILCSNSGRNAVPIEMAQIAKSSGAKVIGITNMTHTKSVKSRHSSGLKLFEICDLYLDNFGEIGDASIEIQRLNTKVGATSTVIGSALLQAIMVEATQILIGRGIEPELFNSSNSTGGETVNQVLIERYKAILK